LSIMVFIFNLAPFLAFHFQLPRSGLSPFWTPVLHNFFGSAGKSGKTGRYFPVSHFPLGPFSRFPLPRSGLPHFGHPVPSFWTLVLHSVFMGLIGPIGPTGLMGVLDFFLVRFVRCVCFCQPFWTPCRHGLPGQTACPAFPDFSAFSIFRLVQRLRD